jgi:hypothetical protein
MFRQMQSTYIVTRLKNVSRNMKHILPASVCEVFLYSR